VAREYANKDPDGVAPQISFYSGSGPMTDFLIMARAPDGNFYDFARDLIFGIRDLNLHEIHNMRTYTHVMAERNFTVFHESPLTATDRELNESLLQLPESEALEFKATYAMDLRRYFFNKDKARNPKLAESFVKAVCGLLNAPSGGRLIVGLLEISREAEHVGAAADEFTTWVSAEFPVISSELGTDKAVVGVEFEFDNDWDKFLIAVKDALADHVDPLPLPFLDFEPLQVQGRTLAVITARASEYWFYATFNAVSQFLVRELASTRVYDGLRAELYRKTHPRQGSFR
jgi:hypothetical protein